jgi:hypothetical protein
MKWKLDIPLVIAIGPPVVAAIGTFGAAYFKGSNELLVNGLLLEAALIPTLVAQWRIMKDHQEKNKKEAEEFKSLCESLMNRVSLVQKESAARRKETNDRLNKFFAEQIAAIAAQRKEIAGVLQAQQSLVVFNGFREALSFFASNARVIARVDNTSIVTKETMATLEAYITDTEWYKKFHESAVPLLTAGAMIFRDGISPLARQVRTHRCNQFAKLGISNMHYVPRLLRTTDREEVTIFHYKDGRPPEVLLGWQGDKESDCIIAKISHPAVVGYFQRQFEDTWSKARPITTVDRRRKSQIDKAA